jgi:RNA polymerase sigma-70 factor (ECF subfamily)
MLRSPTWLEELRGPDREEAVRRLHALLVRAARFELVRRRGMLRGESIDDLAVQCADDALAAVLRKLDDFRAESRFTTWAAKFAILEASVRSRRRAWQDHELPVDPQAWNGTAGGVDPAVSVETKERLETLMEAIRTELTPHQREVLTALIFGEVPIDVLAERVGSTRGALYKTLHDARRKLREVDDGR